MTKPSRDEWARLFAAVDAFRSLSPWQWMAEDEVTGVQDPETGEITWCCVLGAYGEVFGLAAYNGTRGLSIYTRVKAGKLSARSDAIRFGFPGWLASFEDNAHLDESDRRLIRSLG